MSSGFPHGAGWEKDKTKMKQKYIYIYKFLPEAHTEIRSVY